MTKKAIFNWSGGKDSALALYRLLQNSEYQEIRLLTSINQQYQRITMHGVREELLEKQAQKLQLPLHKLYLPNKPGMEPYNQLMQETLQKFTDEGFSEAIFGDIFLEDLRMYREERLQEAGFTARFPLWKEDTRSLMRQFIDLGFKTIVVCVKSDVLDKSFAGRVIDHQFLKDLPGSVDPCGENGEFHTFVYDGPIFSEPVSFQKGEVIYREYKVPESKEEKTSQAPSKDICRKSSMGFWFCNLLPVKSSSLP
ncbi:diphthine--ammonia ligase [Rapidithrix thailandica]|uniref:Diphthine--ammonia ligase n=1 Tax=Rapidithrix thailandica TaxID=413964 RepID=A0AAW9S2E6_9BACT